MKPLDWVIVGGSAVGVTTACLLADAGFSVAILISPASPVLPEGPDDLRSYSLTPASRRILAACGIWERLAPARITPYDRLQVWDAARGATLAFDAASCGRPALAYMVEHSQLQVALQAALLARPTLSVHTATLETLRAGELCCHLQLSNGQSLAARAVAACDGGDSPVRAMVGIECEERPYPQHAVIANVRCDQPHRATARQVFLAEGPLAFLPLPDPQLFAVVWSTTPEAAQALVSASEAVFCAELGRAFDHRLGAVLASTPRRAFPLTRRHANTYSAARVVLLGDAAHQVHPLAGQGLNAGLLDAAVLAERATAAGMVALQHPQALFQRYERQRRGEILALLAATDTLNQLFLAREPWLGWLRNAGLALTHRLDPLKRLLMAHAMGDSGDLPALARPAASELF